MLKTICSVFAILLSFTVFAQKHLHQVGLSYMSSWEKAYEVTVMYPDRPSVDIVTPKDRLGFIGAYYQYSHVIKTFRSGKMSLSAGVPVSLSLFLGVTANEGVSPKNYVFLDLPLQLEYNIGAGASNESDSKFGAYVSAGGALHLMSSKSARYYGQRLKYTQFDPQVGIGIRLMGEKRLLQIGYSRVFPLKQREEPDMVYGYAGGSSAEEIDIYPREIIRGMDMITVSFSLKKYKK